MASQSFGLLCHSVTDIYSHNSFVYLSSFNIYFSVVYNATSVWNSLPTELRQSHSLGQFLRALKTYCVINW